MNMERVIARVDKRIEAVLSGHGEPFKGSYARAGLKEGKKLRARSFLAFCGRRSKRAVDIACSIELLHAATLIHDDIIDNSAARRGKKALYLEDGVPRSVLFGDYLFSEAFKIISSLGDPAVIREMVSALSESLKGEIAERHEKGNAGLGRERYFDIIRMKSGSLFGVSAELGAFERPGKDIPLHRARGFGVSAGMAYQALDDHMDYFGRGSAGKRFNDIREGVVTLPFIYLLRRCSNKEKRLACSLLGRRNARQGELMEVIDIMDKYDISKTVLSEAAEISETARGFLGNSLYGGISRNFDVLSWLKDRSAHA